MENFWIQLETAAQNKINSLPSEDNPISFGNVEFWNTSGEWCYSIPVKRWDIKSISDDITKAIMNELN